MEPISPPAREGGPPPPSRGRLWAFRLLAIFGVPAILLGAVELALRIAGYGYPTSFFLQSSFQGKPVLIENPKFTQRFMPEAMARAPMPTLLQEKKAPGTKRILIFGESAAMGDPEPAYGFGRVLKVLLEARFPDQKFEVVNVAFTAINSHVIREIARDCAGLQPDFWLVYMGNNEVTGPFGAGTVFGSQAPSRGAIDASLAIKRFRLGQLLASLLDRAAPGGDKAAWGGMEMFLQQQVTYDSPALAQVYRHFQRNLEEIISLGAGAGAKVIVSPVVSNLRECGPFGSLHGSKVSAATVRDWGRIYQLALEMPSVPGTNQALAFLRKAEEIDPNHAELQYRLGRALLAENLPQEAAKHFELARDRDTLRFRADTQINQIIRNTSSGRESAGIHLVDPFPLFARYSPHGIVGAEFLFEHVHFEYEGNYLLALTFAEQIRASLTASAQTTATKDWLSAEAVAQRLAVTGWNRFLVLDTVRRRMARPPFTNQMDHAEHEGRLIEQLRKLQPFTQPEALARQAKAYRAALTNDVGDWILHDQFGRLLEAMGDRKEAEAEWRQVVALMPHHGGAYYELGNLLNRGEDRTEAIRLLREALRLKPQFPEALDSLGIALAQTGRPDEAAGNFSRAIEQRPQFVDAHIHLGMMLANSGRLVEAGQSYERALKFNPRSALGHLQLGKLLVQRLLPEKAAEHFREALRLEPGSRLAQEQLEKVETLLNSQAPPSGGGTTPPAK